MYFIDNEIHHRGQGYVYLRGLGIESHLPFTKGQGYNYSRFIINHTMHRFLQRAVFFIWRYVTFVAKTMGLFALLYIV
jgi:hypothetical protein